MKLLNKISFNYIINTALLFLAALFAIYFAVNWVISSRTNGQLRDTTKEVILNLGNGIKQEYPPIVEIKEVDKNLAARPAFSDTSIYSKSEDEEIIYRQHTVYKLINGRNYRIVTRTSLVEKEDLFSAILLIQIGIVSLLLLILFFTNRNTAKKVFRPFYINLKRLEDFSLHKNETLVLEESRIDEFAELNSAMQKLSEKALKEYRSLKEFSEDLSHELQTPVAIIKNKIELLLQDERGNEETINNLQSVFNSVDRLDKLNRALVLLTKLESKDLFPSVKILLHDRINRQLENYYDIAQSKNLTVKLDLETGNEIEFNENLLDILLNNLISNSIKHNINNGEIIVELKHNTLTIKNSGKEPKQNPVNYFKRFLHDEKSPNSLGLGLSIAKKICDLYGIRLDYSYSKPMHILKVRFTPGE